MDLATMLRIVNVLLLVIIAALLFVNRKAEKQTLPRLAFLILLIMFIMQLFIFR
ncbi:MAG: hypothetical protein IJ258_03325 [Methanobrevibacter sp.]|uniref:hypothetical protein n=1 Tax=Methanobrevibacter sp. TaxID=66852 RepID=UPI0025FDD07E|nr:hypothetical protein [Methanobrevibacter sp.]MBQ8017118.1 hypothetical protein [Methanobrevibacter sp.]